MPGFGIEDDELQKLFAEAGNAVKKASRPSATPEPAAAPPPPVAQSPEPAAVAPPRPAAPPPPPAAAPSGPPRAPTQLVGGEQAADAFVGQVAGGSPIRVAWAQVHKLSLGRIGERQLLVFLHGNAPYYFSDDNVAYKGLLKSMGATTAMNWRSLVNEMAGQVTDTSDAGLQALTGGGGMVPRYADLPTFINAIVTRA